MQGENVELSNTGIKFSYLRFLADGAAGLIAILFFVAGYYLDLPLLGSGKSFHSLMSGRIGGEVKIFIMILLGILAVPLGLSLNAAGWFLLGWLQAKSAKFWFQHKENWFVKTTGDGFCVEELAESFNLDEMNVYRKYQFYEELLSAKRPEQLVHIQHIRGLKRLVRSAAMILLSGGVYLLFARLADFNLWWLGFISIFAAILFSFLLSLLEYYLSLAVLFRAFVVSFSSSRCWQHFKVNEAEARSLDRLIRRVSRTEKHANEGHS